MNDCDHTMCEREIGELWDIVSELREQVEELKRART
ncbi:hypothetical protein SAMN04489731_103560 [Amycolatopsis regifaucium]|nr:hypothetical protein SAMN04489731_103560 [Amycolatopsis regifaucium]